MGRRRELQGHDISRRMSAALIDLRISGVVALTGLLCFFPLSLAAATQDGPRREARGDAGGKSVISDAVTKLADAPNYRWATTVATGEPGPSARGSSGTAG
jgi:hypothetical protein